MDYRYTGADRHGRSRHFAPPAPRGARRRMRPIAAALLAALAETAQAQLPTGGQIGAGNGSISQSGDTLTVNQSSDKLSINWQSFNIGADNTVNFIQPGSSAIALNRVVGSDGSEILGHLNANGQVFLINPNGVLFGAGAQVDVGGLVASTLNLSDADFLAGKTTFAGSGGSVVNRGTLSADGGYIALLGGQVSNEGTLSARLGTVALGAGSEITLDFAGDQLVNLGIDRGTLQALVQNHQLIQADGGHVILSAHATDALLDTVINNDGVIEAHTLQNKNGVIELLGGMDGGTVQVAGTLDASAPAGGDGGFIETSGAHVSILPGTAITAAAPQGSAGEWLIDPSDYTIAASGGDITGAALSAILNGGTSVVVLTSASGSGNGDLFVDDAVNWSTGATLTLTAVRDIQINSNITATGNNAGLVLNYGSGRDYYLNNGARITLSGTTPWLSIGGHTYTVINSVGVRNDTSTTTLQGMANNLSGYYALGTDIDASATGTGTWFASGGFLPIGAYGSGNELWGQLHGLGHVITNLTSNRTVVDVALIGFTGSTSIIRDVGLEGGSFTSTRDSVGALVGSNYGIVSNSYANSTVSGNQHVGGLVGKNFATIVDSYATGSAAGLDNVGGLVGYNKGSISSSYAEGGVSSSTTAGGGLVGQNLSAGTITSSYATGDVNSANGTAGGLVGDNLGVVSYSYAEGNVTAASTKNNLGGLVGLNEAGATISYSHASGTVSNGYALIGGLVGDNSGAIDQSYATGAVSSYGGYTGGLVGGNENGGVITGSHASGDIDVSAATQGLTGGLVGRNNTGGSISTSYYSGGTINGGAWYSIGGLVGSNSGSITLSYAGGTVTGYNSVGGLVGYNVGGVSNSYAVASVSATGSAGGFVGTNGGTIDYCYANSTVSGGHGFSGSSGSDLNITHSYWVETGSMTDSAATALTVTQSQQASSYVGWDFTTNWKIYEGHTAPLLRALLTPLTVTADDFTTTYNGSAYSGGLSNAVYSVAGADSSGHLFGLADPYGGARNAGTYAADLWSDQQGYDITVVNGNLTIDPAQLIISSTDVVKTYDGTITALGSAIATAGTTLQGTDTLSGGTYAFTDKNAGTGKSVTVSGVTVNDGNGGNNYNVTYADNTTSTINKADITISSGDVTKTYNGTTTANGNTVVTTGSLYGGDTLSGGSYAFTDPNAGTGKTVTVSGVTVNDGNGGNNYNVTYADNTTSTIDKANLTITADNLTRVYGDANPALTATVSGLQGGDSSTIVTGLTTTATTGANVGTYVIDTSGANAGPNYTITLANNGTLTITPANLTVSVDNKTKVYGDVNPTLTASITGFKNGDSATLVTGLNLSTTATAGSGVGSYAISASGASAGPNYTITTASDGTLTITPAALTIAANNVSRSYGDANPALTATVSGLKNGDSAAVVSGLSTSAGTGSNVGTYLISTAGASAGPNYIITAASDGTLTVTPAALTVAADAKTKAAGNANPALTATVTGLKNGDTSAIVTGLTTTAASDSPSGDYVIDASAADAGPNYVVVATANSTLTITPSQQQLPPGYGEAVGGAVGGAAGGSQGGNSGAPGSDSGGGRDLASNDQSDDDKLRRSVGTDRDSGAGSVPQLAGLSLKVVGDGIHVPTGLSASCQGGTADDNRNTGCIVASKTTAGSR